MKANRMPTKCGSCGQTGHNKRSCPGMTPETAAGVVVANAGASITPKDEAKIRKRVVKCWGAWQAAKDEKRRIGNETKEETTGAEEALRTVVEGANPDEIGEANRQTIREVQGAYVNWQETKANGRTERKSAKDAMVAAEESLNRAVEDTRQLTMFD